jgi:hypothetical protein
MVNDASTGTDIGSTGRQNVVKWLAPTTFADSMTDAGRAHVVADDVNRKRHPEPGEPRAHRERLQEDPLRKPCKARPCRPWFRSVT